MISFFDLSSAGLVVRLASDTNGLSSTPAHAWRGVVCGSGAAHPCGDGCAMAHRTVGQSNQECKETLESNV